MDDLLQITKKKGYEHPHSPGEYHLILYAICSVNGRYSGVLCRSAGQAQMNKSVVKADLHGCLITVQKSKCPSYIGTQGIVLQETQNTFKLICEDDKLKSKCETNII